jgi:hypothetical protein
MKRSCAVRLIAIDRQQTTKSAKIVAHQHEPGHFAEGCRNQRSLIQNLRKTVQRTLLPDRALVMPYPYKEVVMKSTDIFE